MSTKKFFQTLFELTSSSLKLWESVVEHICRQTDDPTVITELLEFAETEYTPERFNKAFTALIVDNPYVPPEDIRRILELDPQRLPQVLEYASGLSDVEAKKLLTDYLEHLNGMGVHSLIEGAHRFPGTYRQLVDVVHDLYKSLPESNELQASFADLNSKQAVSRMLASAMNTSLSAELCEYVLSKDMLSGRNFADKDVTRLCPRLIVRVFSGWESSKGARSLLAKTTPDDLVKIRAWIVRDKETPDAVVDRLVDEDVRLLDYVVSCRNCTTKTFGMLVDSLDLRLNLNNVKDLNTEVHHLLAQFTESRRGLSLHSLDPTVYTSFFELVAKAGNSAALALLAPSKHFSDDHLNLLSSKEAFSLITRLLYDSKALDSLNRLSEQALVSKIRELTPADFRVLNQFKAALNARKQCLPQDLVTRLTYVDSQANPKSSSKSFQPPF